MIRLSLTFLMGSLCPALAIFLLGGHALALFLVGFFMALLLLAIPLCLWPRELAQVLWAWAHAWEDGRLQFSKTLPIAGRELGRQATDPKPNLLAGDVVSALVNLGTSRKKAEQVVDQVVKHQEYGSFQEMFQAALSVVRGVHV